MYVESVYAMYKQTYSAYREGYAEGKGETGSTSVTQTVGLFR